MAGLISLIVVLPLLGFWAWMYRDMSNSQYLSSDEKYHWTLAFVFLNVFGAAWYYAVEFRYRH
jgi:hypothetical protein